MLKQIRHTASLVGSVVREKIKSRRRSPQWDELRDEFLSLSPYCEACGSKKNLQVHHIIPFKTHPELELSYTNLITLCMDENECHLSLGHGGSFTSCNPDVVEDVKAFKNKDEQERKLIVERARQKRKK